MKTIVHIVAALMFVFGSAGFAQADDHGCGEDAVQGVECQLMVVDFGHDADDEHGGSVHCGSAALCALGAPTITVSAMKTVFERTFAEMGFSNEVPTDLQPPRS